MATINHPTYSCDKCGKVFEKRIKVRHSWPKILPYAMDRTNYCDVRFTLDIWHGGSTPDPDLCPDCIREVLLGALEDLDGQTPKEDTVRDFAKDMFDQYRRLTSEGKGTPEILAFASDFFKGLTDGSVRIDKPEKAKAAIREFAGTICARLSGLAAAGKTAEEMMDGVKSLLSEAIAASICRADGERLAEHFAEKGADGIIPGMPKLRKLVQESCPNQLERVVVQDQETLDAIGTDVKFKITHKTKNHGKNLVCAIISLDKKE